MPRKPRSKPAAKRTPETAPAVPDTVSPELATTDSGPGEPSAPAEPDIFDQAVAARTTGQFEQHEVPTAASDTAHRIEAALAVAPVRRASELVDPAGSPQPGHDRANLPSVGTQLPNPRSIDRISLEADDRTGVQMRLLRFRHARGNREDVWIQFDRNPGKEITTQVQAAGFRWEPRARVGDHEGAWVQLLDPGREVRAMLDAERLFKDLGNQIRQTNGLEPVGQVGVRAG